MIKHVFAGILALLVILPVAAQDAETKTIALSGAFDITIPETWTAVTQDGTGFLWTTADSGFRVSLYSPFFQVTEKIGSPAALIESIVSDLFADHEFDSENLETRVIGDTEALTYAAGALSVSEDFQWRVFAYPLDSGFIVAGLAFPLAEPDLNRQDMAALWAALETITLRDNYVVYEGTVVSIPDGWHLAHDDNYGIADMVVTNESLYVRILLWPRYGTIVGFENPRDFLGYIYRKNFSHNGRYDRRRAEPAQVGQLEATVYPFNRQTPNDLGRFERAVLIFELPENSSYVTAQIMSATLEDDIAPVYEVLAAIQPGTQIVCPLFASPGIRIREEPTTGSEIVRQTEAEEETLIAVAQTTGDDGYVWFDVREGWIRSDVIFYEYNTCEGIPVRP